MAEGLYPPLSEEAESKVPRMTAEEAARFAPANARNGPLGFVTQAVLTRPEGMPSHVAHGIGFVNYMNEFDRIKREQDMIRNMTRNKSVEQQLKLIGSFKKMMQEDRLSRMSTKPQVMQIPGGGQAIYNQRTGQFGIVRPPEVVREAEIFENQGQRFVRQPNRSITQITPPRSEQAGNLTDQQRVAISSLQDDRKAIADQLEIYQMAEPGDPGFETAQKLKAELDSIDRAIEELVPDLKRLRNFGGEVISEQKTPGNVVEEYMNWKPSK